MTWKSLSFSLICVYSNVKGQLLLWCSADAAQKQKTVNGRTYSLKDTVHYRCSSWETWSTLIFIYQTTR